MHRPTINLKIREASALIVIIALGLALFVQRSSHERAITQLEHEIKLEKSKQIFSHFMDETFGELGILVIKEPQEVRLCLLSVGGGRIELDQSEPKEMLSQISTEESIKLPNKFGQTIYNEFTSVSMDDQFSSFDPALELVLEFTRNGDTVLMFSGKEGGLNYAKIIVLDAGKNSKNSNRGWFKFDSSLIDNMRCHSNQDFGDIDTSPARSVKSPRPVDPKKVDQFGEYGRAVKILR